MSAERIARALGGRRCGRGWVCRCPAHEDREPSLSLAVGEGGRLLAKCHAGCDFRDVLAALRRLGLIEDRHGGEELPRPKPKPPADDAGRTEAALRIWAEARDPRGTVVGRYLASRGLELELEAGVAGRVLRFHPACPFGAGVRHPCMIALYRNLRTDAPTAIHRTAITPEGVKVGRKMLGPAAGSAIKLDADDWVELGLVIGEGVETCLAARTLGLRPVWALGAAGAIGALPVLGGIEGLTILGETDDSGAAAAAAQACVRRWTAAGCDVEVLEPVIQGDANDVLRARARHG